MALINDPRSLVNSILEDGITYEERQSRKNRVIGRLGQANRMYKELQDLHEELEIIFDTFKSWDEWKEEYRL